jgi:hypothetical protein
MKSHNLDSLFEHFTKKKMNRASKSDDAQKPYDIEVNMTMLVKTACALAEDPSIEHYDLILEIAGLSDRDKASEYAAIEIAKKMRPDFFYAKTPEPSPAKWYDFAVKGKDSDGKDHRLYGTVTTKFDSAGDGVLMIYWDQDVELGSIVVKGAHDKSHVYYVETDPDQHDVTYEIRASDLRAALKTVSRK